MKRMVRMSLLGLFAVSLLASCNNNGKDKGKDDSFTAKEPELKEDYVEEALGVNMDMVYVKGGIFNMGATIEQGNDASSNENPVRTIWIDGYHIGKYEVTQAQWRAVMGKDVEGYTYNRGEGDDYPIYYVRKEEAQEFCQKLSEATGKKYVLPTEAMWEYAARGGVHLTKTKYAGSNDLDEVAWYNGNSESATHPVGSKKANALGIYDMSGNVQEWVSDKFSYSYDEKDKYNPQNTEGASDVARGGSWDKDAKSCRVSFRKLVSGRDSDLGFRVAVLL